MSTICEEKALINRKINRSITQFRKQRMKLCDYLNEICEEDFIGGADFIQSYVLSMKTELDEIEGLQAILDILERLED